MTISKDGRSSSRKGGWAGALALAYVTSVALGGATLLSPLFPTYEEEKYLTGFLITVIFAVYVVGALGMMWLGESLSRKFGRKPLLIVALGLVLIADVLYYMAGGVALLTLGRLLSGAGVGVFVAIGSLAIIDQLDDDRTEAGSLTAATGTVLGLAAGSIISGYFATQFADTLHSPYLVHIAAVLLAFIAMVFVAPTVAVDRDRTIDYALPRIPDSVRAVFIPSAIAAFGAFSVGGFFGAVAPAFVTEILDVRSPFAIGLIASLVFGFAAVGNFVNLKLPESYAPLAGALILLVGVCVLGVGLYIASLASICIGAAIAGLGDGLALQAGLNAIKREASDEDETEAVTLFFMICYSALAIPILLAGVVELIVDLQTTAVGFAVAVALLLVAAILLLWRNLRNVGENAADSREQA